MAIQLHSDMWMPFEGEQVTKLVARLQRRNWRNRAVDHHVRIDTAIERVLIGREHLGEFAVQIRFSEWPRISLDANEALTLTMADGWICRGRKVMQKEKLLLMLCPAFDGNGLPRETITVRAPVQKQLPSPRGTFFDRETRELNL